MSTLRDFSNCSNSDLNIPFGFDEIKATYKLMRSKKDGYIRPVAWRGSEKMAISAFDATTHVAIATWSWPSYFSPDKIMQGIRLTKANWVDHHPNLHQ